MELALRRAGRTDSVTLVAVTKRQPPEVVAAARAAGLTDVGENYVQEAQDKRAALDQWDVRWHLLGHLQSNKAKAAVQTFDLVQSVDSVSLARTLGRHAGEAGTVQPVLLQVHLGTEESKFGLPPEEALDGAAQVKEMPGVEIRGLMGIAPQGEDPRPHFRLLRGLFDRLPAPARQILSMGMTTDFETAIEEGATLIRIGTALFGPRS